MKLLFLLGAAALCSCTSNPPADVRVTDLWAQPVNASGSAVAVYMTIVDGCSRPETLRAVAAKPPQQASLHTSRVVDNALAMARLDTIPVACGTPVRLKPMGMHVMVTGLQKPAGIGDRLPLTLTFDRSGDVNVVAEITTLAVLENVDPMHMHMKAGSKGMAGMHMP